MASTGSTRLQSTFIIATIHASFTNPDQSATMMSHRFNLLAIVAVLLAVSGEAKQLRATRDLVNAEEVSK